jgi:hypothetical protein
MRMQTTCFVSGNLSCSSHHPQMVDAIGEPATNKLVIGHPIAKAIQVPWRSAKKAHTGCVNLKGLQNVWAREFWLPVEYLTPRQKRV